MRQRVLFARRTACRLSMRSWRRSSRAPSRAPADRSDRVCEPRAGPFQCQPLQSAAPGNRSSPPGAPAPASAGPPDCGRRWHVCRRVSAARRADTGSRREADRGARSLSSTARRSCSSARRRASALAKIRATTRSRLITSGGQDRGFRTVLKLRAPHVWPATLSGSVTADFVPRRRRLSRSVASGTSSTVAKLTRAPVRIWDRCQGNSRRAEIRGSDGAHLRRVD